MGLAKRVIDPVSGEHIPFKTDKSLTGTASYASIHAHCGEELSRRDDLEAIGYVFIYFLEGSLPWQNLHAFSKSEKYKKIKEKKMQISVETLCRHVPEEFAKYLNYCRNLQFEDKPDYQYLKNLFVNLAKKENIDLHDKRFDWSIKAMTISGYPGFYDFFKNSQHNPLNKYGKFIHVKSFDQKMKETEEEIYAAAQQFRFRPDPKQMMRLLNKEELHRYREPDRIKLEQ
jgi:hypothetical protein